MEIHQSHRYAWSPTSVGICLSPPGHGGAPSCDESGEELVPAGSLGVDVVREIEATDIVLGGPDAVRNFVLNAAQRLGINVTPKEKYWLLTPPFSRVAPPSLPSDAG